MKKRISITSIILLGTFVIFLGFIYLSNPIVLNGSSSTYEDINGEKDIIIHFYNEGIGRVLLKEVLINNQVDNTKVELGISYDTSQLVQSGTDNKLIMFGELDKEYVNSRIPSEEILSIINKKEMTPIHYGIRIKDYEKPIESITIKYKYLGFPVSKELTFN
ncbi:hypothetical protein [Sporosarcina koreensis]|uniref:DUF5067 domain-containing protein n=1 Tax=Sporosarcina koreensis TaxID=334735 RepID=A0ABW0TWJ2_9BACL